MKEIRSVIPDKEESFYEAVLTFMRKDRKLIELKQLYESTHFSLLLNEAIQFASIPH
jgi:hypothetical protein